MANTDSNSEKLNNGYEKVDMFDLEGYCYIAMDYAEKISNLFAAIKRLNPNDPEIVGLAEHGKGIADYIDNDADVIRGRMPCGGGSHIAEH